MGEGDEVSAGFLFAAAFLASAVEMVEALTIVLAVGISRGWRSALVGVGAATLALGAIVAALGTALTLVPIDVLRLVVGWLLLAFGLQWLRKAILRAGGFVPVHDEEAIYVSELEQARSAGLARHAGLDWYSFTISFKGVFLEGMEVAFIVISFGSRRGCIPIAAAAAGAAVLAVASIGVLVRAPLGRVPENTLKFVVGVMLTTFGIFWSAEGAGVSWPGKDAALPGVLGFVLLVSLSLVQLLRRLPRSAGRTVAELPVLQVEK
ncbi:MAG: COG4280 domain-containing protein [Gaiellaceae bacterium]